MGVRPNVVTLNIDPTTYDRNMRAAMSLLETMRRTGLRPTIYLHTLMKAGSS